MLHRSVIVAVVAAMTLATAGASYAQSNHRGTTIFGRQAERAAPVQRQQRNNRFDHVINRGGVVGPVFATTSFSCTNENTGAITTYTLSVDGGACSRGTVTDANGNTSYLNQGACANSSGDSASGNCNGCGNTTGSGSCTQTTTPPR